MLKQTKWILIAFILLVAQGCMTIGHKKFYDQVAPSKYPPTSKVIIFEYANVNLKELYDLLFNDFLIIGESSFNGPYEGPRQSISFAKSIGADVFISTSQFKETRTSFMNLSTPTTSTTYLSGYSGSGSFYGTATTYGTTTTTIPIQVNRYAQGGLYLKNINNILPLWERVRDQHKRTSQSPIEGLWKNENYELELFQSGQQIVAFIVNKPKNKKVWNVGQLKMIYGVDSGVGVYLMGDKTPMPAKFKINKFGHLEVTLLAQDDTFSFARKK